MASSNSRIRPSSVVSADSLPEEVMPSESQVNDKRKRHPSRKALQNAIQTTTAELSKQARALRSAADSVYIALREKSSLDQDPLQAPTKRYEETLTQLEGLYAQDKWGDNLGDAEEIRQSSRTNLEYARTAITKAKTTQSTTYYDRASRMSRKSSRVPSSRSSSSSMRTKALAEAAAAKKQAEYDRLIAEREHERRQRDAEEQRLREQRNAQYDRETAMLAAERLAAIADAKLNAIERSIEEEGISYNPSREDMSVGSRCRTQEWIMNQENTKAPAVKHDTTPPEVSDTSNPVLKDNGNVTLPTDISAPLYAVLHGGLGSSLNQQTNKTGRDFEHLQAIVTTNKQLTASLARQSLPKCHPDTFQGDATLFHPWKSAFKAMIQNAEIPPEQEINYLRQYTKGDAQKLVDSYRKRQHREPTILLRELWAELEKRFGNTAVITNTLLRKLIKAAKFNEKEREKLQAFADVCADLDSQLQLLPGLACLNYPNTIAPIVEKLPPSLRSKWEKQVAEYAERNQNAYPGFHDFTVIMQNQATLRNHPNILAGTVQSPRDTKDKGDQNGRTPPNLEAKRILKSKTEPTLEDHQDTYKTPDSDKHCVFHDTSGHDLTNCKAFARKTLAARTEWIKRARLCFRCLSSKHQANDCKEVVSCEKCGSNRHQMLLHMEKRKKEIEENGEEKVGEEVKATCTAICHTRSGGLSCSKIILLDVFQEKQPDRYHRVYAIIDDQSNASMITPSLADKLNANGPREKFLLSTCSAERELKHGRRVTGLAVKSIGGEQLKLPTLVECDHIPSDKGEIPTPEIAHKFHHLRDIADQIPPVDPNADIEILIGRDAPELLKVRAFRNGPKGAPWAQKLKLGWTVSGQVCLDRVGGAVHISVRSTAVSPMTPNPSYHDQDNQLLISDSKDSPCYDITPCSNRFVIKEDYGRIEQIATDVYRTTADDNEASLSQDDRRFLNIMERNIRKNEQGNWEMPLPFRESNVTMPNNRKQAVNRLNSLVRSFKRKPKLQEDYFDFMGRVLSRGHAVQLPAEEPPNNKEKSTNVSQRGRVWYLPHFGVYHPKKPTQIRVVFDSSAEYEGTSLNKQLLPGPDQMNSLLGVLVRFRQENVGLMCDIEQMFHSFYVKPEHQDFLRFLWYRNNNPSEEIVEYRMLVHLFGNASSPAIATFGMRKTAEEGKQEFGSAAKEFVHNDFYVDDGLTSLPTDEEATELLKTTQAMLAIAQLRLHKVVSNSVAVMEALP